MKLLIVLCLVLAGCSTPMPSWSDATPKQRQEGNFNEDDAYFNSPEGQQEMDKEADAVIRLRHQIWGK